MSNGDRTTLSEQQWRLLWEERLDPETRRRIWRAALSGTSLGDPDEAAVAIEFARRRRRIVRTAALINSGTFIALLLAMALMYEPPMTSTFWFMAGGWLLGLVATPVVALWLRHKLQQCEERNRFLLTSVDE